MAPAQRGCREALSEAAQTRAPPTAALAEMGGDRLGEHGGDRRAIEKPARRDVVGDQ